MLDKTAQPSVCLVVCGGIAAYKACEVLRGLQKAGCDVRVVMTEDATQFVGKTTFEALTHHEVVLSLYNNVESPVAHVDLADWADCIVVVPATANIMAKMAYGIADNAASATLLAAHTPVLVAPAMNTHMWTNPATQANVALLRQRGIQMVMPESGRLACGYTGDGKLAPVQQIVDDTLKVLSGNDAAPSKQDLAGKKLLITAGPTHEKIDPVRFIANCSTGKLGYTVAKVAASRGADVTLISGPTYLEAPQGVNVQRVVSAEDMYKACVNIFDGVDAAILTAAVADYTPAHPADHKLKKSLEYLESIDLKETTDILASLSKTKKDQVVVGFAAETNNLLEHAQAKLERKGCSMIVANDVSRPDSTFGSDTDRVAFVTPQGVEQLETLPLADVASELLDRVAKMLEERA